MVESSGFTSAVLGLLLLLGGCAGDGPPEGTLAPAATTVVAPAGGTVTAITVRPDDSGEPLEDLKDRAAPDELSIDAAMASADGEVDELLSDAKRGDDAVAAPPPIAPDEGAAAEAVASRPAGTEVGYLLIDLETGQVLAELNPDLPLIPASTIKLATAVVALDVLGPEHRYRTELLTDGVIRQGVLEGDLILRGNGDPSLDVADLLGLAVRLETTGIRRVAGDFVIDDTALPRLTEIEPTQPAEAPYNPGIGALSLAFNRVNVAWRGGGRVDALTLPPLAGARFEGAPPGQLPPGGVEFKGAGGEVWRVADRGRRRQQASLPVKDPGLHAGQFFHRLALAQGIALGPPRRGVAPSDARRLAVHESAPLRYLLRDMLLYSNNMMAETIGLTAAQRLGNAGDLKTAGDLLVDHLGWLMPEVDWQGAVLGNHSGLDGTARLTPRQLAAIVRYGWRADALPALLPGGGWSGTLTRRFAGPEEALRVWAKTGTVNYGSALAGYLFPTTDRPALFVTMVSDVSARAAYDRLLPHPGPAAQANAGGWNARARRLQDDLVGSWLAPLPTS